MKNYIVFILIFTLLSGCSEEPTEPKNISPIINSISIVNYPTMQDSIFRGDLGIELECDSYDEDGSIADYLWEATGGTIRGAAHHARWDAPTEVPGIYYIICTVKDNDDNIARKEFAVDVLNRKPVIIRISIYPGWFGDHNPNVNVGEMAQFLPGVDNPEKDRIDFKYIMPDTTTAWMQGILFWTVPSGLPDTNVAYVYVKDEYGAMDKDSIEFYVHQ